uniref:Uncharacterized protein n=1 Tax=Oryza brachyantha TaxID=4533 RepID=J3MQB5_ORYBR
PLRGLRLAPPRARRRALRHAVRCRRRPRGRRRRRRRRGGGDAGGVQGVRRRRRRVHLGVGAAGGAQEAGAPGGRQPRHRARDDLQRRPQQRRPRRLRRVQVHDAGHHRLERLIHPSLHESIHSSNPSKSS